MGCSCQAAGAEVVAVGGVSSGSYRGPICPQPESSSIEARARLARMAGMAVLRNIVMEEYWFRFAKPAIIALASKRCEQTVSLFF
jgi:hypothetical protein